MRVTNGQEIHHKDKRTSLTAKLESYVHNYLHVCREGRQSAGKQTKAAPEWAPESSASKAA